MEDYADLFGLEEDEDFEKICGELLLTTKGRIILHCTLCDKNYKDFKEYSSHVLDKHMETVEVLDEISDIGEAETIDAFDTECDVEDDSKETLKIEIKCLNNEALQEDEMPLSMIKSSQRKEKLNKNTTPPPALKNSSVQVTVSDEGLVIPAVIRDVKKFNYWCSKAPSEERKFKCPICGVGFKQKCNMHYHFKRHSNEKDHACPDCGKKFYGRAEVRAHRRFHAKDRNFLCSDCGLSFKSHTNLYSHIKRHKNQRDYKCKICDKAFFDGCALKKHMYVHTKEKAFTCEVCHNNFARPNALTNHMKLHENKRAYKCSICEAGFNQKAGLFSHMKVTHKAT